MNDHNLDDLIIDNIEPKNGKTKSLLTIIALLIVVLIVAIILTKILLKSPTNPELSFEENNTEMIAPELKLQEKPKVSKPKEDDLSLSNIIEKKLTTPKEEVKKPIEIKEETIVVDEEVVVENTKPVIEEPAIEKPVIQKSVVEKEVIKQEPKKIETPKVVTPKVEAPKTVTKPKTTPKVVKNPTVTHKATSGVKYYVQVGSFAKDPSTRLLSVLKNSGFAYSVSAPEANGNKRVLIGPYRSRAEVDKALKEVRDRITKTAFVFTK